MTVYRISPVDTLFFRDGRPYNQGEDQTNVPSMFPPSPYSIVGALRAGIARKMKWDGESPWGPDITIELGDGLDLGKLEFNGPYIAGDGKPLFPVPQHLLGKKEKDGDNIHWSDITALAPGKNEVISDMGKIRFPVQSGEKKLKNIEGYLNSPDMSQVLNGETEDLNPIQKDKVWKHEFNIGINRDEDRNVGEGGLFSRRFVRLGEKQQDGSSMEVALLMEIKGTGETFTGPAMLGGESKAAFVENSGELKLPTLPDTGKLKRFMAILVTPGDLGVLKVGQSVEGLNHARLVSVCADRPQMIGGWDFRKGPLPLRPHMRAGTVLFFESDEGVDPRELNGTKIGRNTEFGFGQILIGKW